MDFKAKGCGQSEEEMDDFRRGPWTVEEDLKLMDYIATHGEGRWNSLARCAGLKRTGKSCRLRWLNYLRPDVRRGNITPEEQLLILELHSRWGNRWSKIAQQLPGRTDNEIKNYWRTRVQKHAKQLKCDVNSKQFKDAIRYLWIPRLVERIQAAAAASANTASTTSSSANGSTDHQLINNFHEVGSGQMVFPDDFGGAQVTPSYTPENSSTASDSFGTQVSPVTSDMTDYYSIPVSNSTNPDYYQPVQVSYSESLLSPLGFYNNGLDFQSMEQNTWSDSTVGDASYNLWNVEDFWSLQHQINNSTL